MCARIAELEPLWELGTASGYHGVTFGLGLPEMAADRHAFGVKGSGGSIAYADPTSGFTFALTKNRLTGPTPDIAGQIRETLDLRG
jgi:CubicO group peptidase (beta-lactamase class C family)